MVDQVRELQAAGARLTDLRSSQKALQPAAKVGRLAEVRFGRRICGAEGEDSRRLRQSAQTGARVGRIEADGIG